MPYRYKCSDYPGMETCPGAFTADAEGELWKHIELHAIEAHQEDPKKWTSEDRQQVQKLIVADAL